jgi:hypothetical protein
VEVLNGLHMHVLDDHLELAITDADVDTAWQITDLDATLSAYRAQAAELDAQLTAAVKITL